MDTTDYVSYPVALALKKAGFDWPCFAHWSYFSKGNPMLVGTTVFMFSNSEMKGDDAAAPLLFHAQKWLREEKYIHVEPAYAYEGKLILYIKTSKLGLFKILDQQFDSYETALSAGIEAALELITKKGE